MKSGLRADSLILSVHGGMGKNLFLFGTLVLQFWLLSLLNRTFARGRHVYDIMRSHRHPPPFFTMHAMEVAPVPAWEYHVHSHFSDGSASVADIVKRARALGLTRLAFTEHTEPGLVQGEGWFDRYWHEVDRLRCQEIGGMEIVIGLEVPIIDYDGGLLMDPDMDDRAEFVLGAVHAYPGHGWRWDNLTPRQAIDLEFKGLMSLAENARVDAIAHPGGICHKYATPFPLSLFEEVVRKATDHGIAIELNPAYHDPMRPYLDVCRRHDALISPGSNVHHPDEMGLAWEVLRDLKNTISER